MTALGKPKDGPMQRSRRCVGLALLSQKHDDHDPADDRNQTHQLPPNSAYFEKQTLIDSWNVIGLSIGYLKISFNIG